MVGNISRIRNGCISMRVFSSFVFGIWCFPCGTLVLFDVLHSEGFSSHLLFTYVCGRCEVRSIFSIPFPPSSPTALHPLIPNTSKRLSCSPSRSLNNSYYTPPNPSVSLSPSPQHNLYLTPQILLLDTSIADHSLCLSSSYIQKHYVS